MIEKQRSWKAYWGEGLREAGILIAVFGPMYLKFENRESALLLLSDSSLWAVCGIIIFNAGIALERKT